MSSLSRLSSDQVDEEIKKYNIKINNTGFSIGGISLANIKNAIIPYDETSKLLPTREQFMMLPPSNKSNTILKMDSGFGTISSVITGNVNHNVEIEYRRYLANKADKEYTFDEADYRRTFITVSSNNSSYPQGRDESLVSAPAVVTERKYLKYKTKYLTLKHKNQFNY